MEFRNTYQLTGTTSGAPTMSGIERSVLTFENCAPRIESIHTDLVAGFIQTPDENFATASNNKYGRVLQMCSNHLLFCRGELAEYTDLDDCVTRMRAKPGVCYDFSLRGDTVDCRVLHLLLARFNPIMHCPHMAEFSEVCGFDDCPGGLCGYANTHLSPDFFTADRWQQSECAPPLPPTETPLRRLTHIAKPCAPRPEHSARVPCDGLQRVPRLSATQRWSRTPTVRTASMWTATR